MGRRDETLAQAAAGDQIAFAQIVQQHQAMVFSLAYHFLHDQTLAEEVAQEVFLHLYQNLAAIESPAHLAYWLRRVTSHRCIDQARKQRGQRHMSIDEIPEPSTDFPSSDPLLSEMLRRFVAALPEEPRLIVTLRYQEDLDPVEIAQLLEIPVNTVKSHLRRSLALLREKLARRLGEVEV